MSELGSNEEPIMTNQEAMDAIEKRPEDSTCHSVGLETFFNIMSGDKLLQVPYHWPIQDSKESLKSAIESIHAFREQIGIQAIGMTSHQIKTLLEDTVRNMRKLKEYCESTDYNTEVYEYHNSDCFYYELNEIHVMSDEIIKNFEKKLDTGI